MRSPGKRHSVSSEADQLCIQFREQQQKSDYHSARQFVESTLNITLESDDLHRELRDGVLLCRLVNVLKPGTITSIKQMNKPFMKMENISYFLQGARELGLQPSELFQTVDLYEAKDMGAVVNTLLTLARVSRQNRKAQHVSMPTTKSKPMTKKASHVKTTKAAAMATPTGAGEYRHVKTIFSGQQRESTLSVDEERLLQPSAAVLLDRQDQLRKPAQSPPSRKVLDSGYNTLVNQQDEDMHRLYEANLSQISCRDHKDQMIPTPSLSTPCSISSSSSTSQSESTEIPSAVASCVHAPHRHKSEEVLGGKEREGLVQIMLRQENKTNVLYHLGNCIGKGQFGSVYRALNVQTGETVAIKRIRLEDVGSEHEIMKEVELLKDMTSPHIVQYLGLVQDSTYFNIILEYIENGSLLSTVKAFGRLPEKLVAIYTFQILSGLAYLHRHSVVHCDLKAANILTTKSGTVKLTDFGVSLNLMIRQEDALGAPAGTPNWMAPEVIELKGASTKSDIWSLGCTIIELLTGKPPYAGMYPMSTLYHIVEDDHPPIPEDVSEPLRNLLLQCFQKNPDDRPTAETLMRHSWVAEGQKDETMNNYPSAEKVQVEEKVSEDDIDLTALYKYIRARPSPPSQPPVRPVMSGFVKHLFVKTTFGKAVTCKVCGVSVRRHAYFCEACAMICHDKCRFSARSCERPTVSCHQRPREKNSFCANDLDSFFGGSRTIATTSPAVAAATAEPRTKFRKMLASFVTKQPQIRA
ncbi:kinase-like domain-containing protein [Dichotomocladium elegans]|nr:kinase-like domain-containing protein [Dichotomocladium elegans]